MGFVKKPPSYPRPLINFFTFLPAVLLPLGVGFGLGCIPVVNERFRFYYEMLPFSGLSLSARLWMPGLINVGSS